MKTEPNDPSGFSLMHNSNGNGDCLVLNISGEQQYIPFHKGLTKREHFASLAMQGRMSSWSGPTSDMDLDYIADLSVKAADALIAALNQKEEGK